MFTHLALDRARYCAPVSHPQNVGTSGSLRARLRFRPHGPSADAAVRFAGPPVAYGTDPLPPPFFFQKNQKESRRPDSVADAPETGTALHR
jgi:hypothetical protein